MFQEHKKQSEALKSLRSLSKFKQGLNKNNVIIFLSSCPLCYDLFRLTIHFEPSFVDFHSMVRPPVYFKDESITKPISPVTTSFVNDLVS